MEELPEMPVLDIPMTPSAPKSGRTDKIPSPETADAGGDETSSHDSFEAAYSADGETEAKPVQEDIVKPTAETDVEAPRPSAEREEGDIAVVQVDADTTVDIAATTAAASVETAQQDVEVVPQKPRGPDTSALAFAQRLLSEQGATTTETGATPIIATETAPKQGQVIDATKVVPQAAPTAEGTDPMPKGSLSGAIPQDMAKPTASPQATGSAPAPVLSPTMKTAAAEAKAASVEQMTRPVEPRRKGAEHRSTLLRETAHAVPPPQTMQTAPIPMAVPAQSVMPLTAQTDTVNPDLQIVPVGEVDAPTAWDPRSPASATLTQALNRPETPGMIGRQMAEILQRNPDRPVELSLNPAELGRVRLNIAAAEGGITVHILAERPETLDLMRRHIDQLAQEFQALGYDSINFAFNDGQSGRDADQQGDDAEQSGLNSVTAEVEADVAVPITLAPVSGVDLRV